MTKTHKDTLLTPELCCSNIKISLAFYTEILGFSIQADNIEVGQRQFIVLDPDGYMLRFVDDLGLKRCL